MALRPISEARIQTGDESLGNKLEFNGTSTFLEVTRTTSFPFFNDNPTPLKSLSVWVYCTDTSGVIFSEGNSGNSIPKHQLTYDTSTGKLTTSVINNGNVSILSGSTDGTYFTANAWHHVVYTISNTSVKIYIDNRLVGSFTATLQASTYNRAGLGALLSATVSGFMTGFIDEFRMYNKELVPLEIGLLYDHREISSTNLKLYYNFNETSGGTTSDSSGNSNDGTVTDGTFLIGETISRGTRTTVSNRFYIIPNNKSLYFNGSNALATIANINPINGFNIGFWINPHDGTSTNSFIINQVGTGDLNSFALRFSSNPRRYEFIIRNGASLTADVIATLPVVFNKWQHIVFSWIPNNMKGYLNLAQIASDTSCLMSEETTFPITIGRLARASGNFGKFYMAGLVIEARDTHWTSQERTDLYWRTIKSTGSSFYTFNDVATDQSSYGNNITVTNTSYSTNVPSHFGTRHSLT